MKFPVKITFYLTYLIIFFISLAGCRQQQDDPLQKECKKQCEAYFNKEYGDGVFDDQKHSGSIFYKYHFNKKLNKCFILLDESGYKRSDDKLYKMKFLLDTGEKGKYGFFYHMGASIVCEVLENKCRSEKEWDALVKPYMEK